jgi:PAS domain-containing protein
LENRPLNVEVFENPRPRQQVGSFNLSAEDLLEILSSFDPYGLWRLDLETGQVFWSPDVFQIHGLEQADGPVDMNEAFKLYHPEDARTLCRLIDDAIRSKSGYRFVLRLRMPGGKYRLIKSIARYRDTDGGSSELVGVFSRFALDIRSIATVEY